MSLAYLDSSSRDDRRGGGSRRIPITTPSGRFEVWTKRVGNNPSLRLLLLHGGPGSTHEYFEAADSRSPAAEVEVPRLRPVGFGLELRPGRRPPGTSTASSTKSSRCGPPWASTGTASCCSGHSWGGIPRCGVRTGPWAAWKRPGYLQHDDGRPGLQHVRPRRADAGQRPPGAGRDRGVCEASGHYENPRFTAAADGAPRRAPCAAHAGERLAGPGQAWGRPD